MKNILLALVICLVPLPGLAAGPMDGGDRPLLIPGKHSLYQRVLSAPGARLAREPGGQADAKLVPFTALYVYSRMQQGGREWVEVGMDRYGGRHAEAEEIFREVMDMTGCCSSRTVLPCASLPESPICRRISGSIARR